MSTIAADARLRVAIVGLGPKGLFALERLLHHARDGELGVDLFEPHPVPGAGLVYDPGEPDYLLMNLAAEYVDLWPADSRAVPAAEQQSFVAWRRDGVEAADYPPRGDVGRYLADGLARLRRHAPPGVSIRLRGCAVEAIEPAAGRWQVTSDDGAAGVYDEVLVTTGHGPAEGPGAVAGAWPHAAPLVPTVFPVTDRLAPARVAPGSTVAVRGFALTFIDAALALSEGRGGSFAREAGHPWRLRYTPGAAEPAVVLPFSRSGRPMLVKPPPALADAVPALGVIARDGRAEILALPDRLSLGAHLLGILAARTAAALLAAGDSRRSEPLRQVTAAARSWLDAASTGAAPATDLTPVAEIEQSLAIAAGLRRPDLPWALGHTWRSLYSALVARLAGRGLAEAQWPAFLRLAAQMERVAFGPPPENAAKLLALIAAGRVDLTHVRGGTLTTRGASTALSSSSGGDERQVGVVVDAVLPAPGTRHGVLGRLLADGHVRGLPARRGLQTAADATAIGLGGRPTPGLAIVGRATEDCVIGNDTITRAMHPQADRWAARVGARAAARPAAVEARG